MAEILNLLSVFNADSDELPDATANITDSSIPPTPKLKLTGLFLLLLLPVGVIGFFAYKLVSNMREKERLKEDKKKLKLQRKEKETKKKVR